MSARRDFVHLRGANLAAAGRGLRGAGARALFGVTNVLVMFGGSKDVAFNLEISDLVGLTRVSRTRQTGTI
jgi:hypothetical protein